MAVLVLWFIIWYNIKVSYHNNKYMKSYFFPLLLLTASVLGGVVGHFIGPQAIVLKPLGDIFLNILLTAIVPLVFFSIAAAIARLGAAKQIWQIGLNMLITFIGTGITAAFFMFFVVTLFPPVHTAVLPLASAAQDQSLSLFDHIVKTFSVSEFNQLLSHQHLLPLIIFSLLVGSAALLAGEKGKVFRSFLESGAVVSQHVMGLILTLAPIGFFAFFAVLIGTLGPSLLNDYFRVTVIYYLSGCFYFIGAFSIYAYLANRKKGLIFFWRNMFLPILTSLATCSSAASIPVNMQAAKNIGVSAAVCETVIPLGAVLHKDGSVLGGMLKIAFLFGIFHLDFTGLSVVLLAVSVSLMVGLVMGAIPSGGMLGELFILSAYGFPPESLMMIAAISIIIDPLATMINSTGDIVASMLTARLSGLGQCEQVKSGDLTIATCLIEKN